MRCGHAQLALSAFIGVLLGCEPGPSLEQRNQIAVKEAREAALAAFQQQQPTLKIKLEQLIAEGQPGEVIKLTDPWLGHLNSDVLALRRKAQEMVTEHRIAELVALTKKLKPTEHASLLLYYAELEKLDPHNVEWRKRWAAHRSALNKIEETERKRALAADRAERRKRGVTIGMSKADVLYSSWGPPRRVNSTTTARGTREQWVYDGGYLYFNERGILTTIQN